MDIQKALEEYNDRIEELGGCGDHGCRIAKPEGMGTSGGCRCVKDQLKMQKFVAFSIEFRDKVSGIESTC